MTAAASKSEIFAKAHKWACDASASEWASGLPASSYRTRFAKGLSVAHYYVKAARQNAQYAANEAARLERNMAIKAQNEQTMRRRYEALDTDRLTWERSRLAHAWPGVSDYDRRSALLAEYEIADAVLSTRMARAA